MASRSRARVFLDANVLFSSVYSDSGAPAELVRRAIRGEFQAVLSRRVLAEVVRNLHRKAPRALAGLERILVHGSFEVVPEADVSDVENLAALREDAPIVAAAIEAGCDYFCTGDGGVRRRIEALDVRIEVRSPREVVDLLTTSGPAGYDVST